MNFEKAIQQTIKYLSSKEAIESIQRDPYWPKWDSPWWHMQLLHELRLTSKIPANAISTLVSSLKNHYLPFFPFTIEELPEGKDPRRHIACHCLWGCVYQMLFAYGVNVEAELPFIRKWFLKYQLPDGGLNCDEAAYIKVMPKSSIISTVPCLEAVLYCNSRELSVEEKEFLEKGAQYLLKHRLFRRASSDEVICEDWREVKFPRFYDYDFLRGYAFLVRYRQYSGFNIPNELEEEVHTLMEGQIHDGSIRLKRFNVIEETSYNPTSNMTWERGPLTQFELMNSVSFPGSKCDVLTQQWNELKSLA